MLLSALMKNSGDVIFGNLQLIFISGCTVGFTENDGVSAIAATIGYGNAGDTRVMAVVWKVEPVMIIGHQSDANRSFRRHPCGGLAAGMFSRFCTASRLFVWAFCRKRFVPIVTTWRPLSSGYCCRLSGRPSAWRRSPAAGLRSVTRAAAASCWLCRTSAHPLWPAPYLERPFFFRPTIYRWQRHRALCTVTHPATFAGDPTAGILARAFLFKMFGLPAAAIAMWHSAKPENKFAVGGIMLSAALTSFLTGITEPH